MKLTFRKPVAAAPEFAPKPHPTVDRGVRQFDKTQLKEASYQQQVHRDYAAHYFRWSFAKRFCKKGVKVLEVGCGQDIPLVKVLAPAMSHIPDLYVGCDMNKLPAKFNAKWANFLPEFDFTSRWKEIQAKWGAFDLAVSFEVIEHMAKGDGKKFLEGIHGLLGPDGTAIISTPVYNGKHMAANHIHEYEFNELKAFFEANGFVVKDVHGTFMTSQSMKRVCTPQERELIDELSKFHCWDVLANFLAPKYPEASSNCCWILQRKDYL